MNIKEISEKACVTCDEMKALEKAADQAGLSYYTMMENAGTAATNGIIEVYSAIFSEKFSVPLGQTSALIFCGKGNNGGDGFVVARLLKDLGVEVTVLLVGGEPKTPDAVTNYHLIEKMDIPVINIEDDEKLAAMDKNPHIVVDAIYGTGFSGSLKENAQKCISAINRFYRQGSFVAALDLPSGLPGDMDPEANVENAVKANATFTFHAKKQVHFNPSAQKYCGQVVICDIGIGDALK